MMQRKIWIKYNKRIKHHDKREKEYTDENRNKYTERKLFKSVMKVPVVDESPYHYNFKASRR